MSNNAKNNNRNNARFRPKQKHKGQGRPDSSGVVRGVPTAHMTATGIKPGWPSERVVKLNYADFASVTCGTTAAYKQQYRMTSCHDPDQTGVGGQPLGFDQWAALYNHYVVEKVEMIVMFDGNSSAPIVGGVYVSDDVTVPADSADLIALGADYCLLSGGTLPTKCQVSLDVSRFFGRKDPATDSALRALVSANPAEVVYATIFLQGIDRTTALTCGYCTKMVMTVRFMEPKDIIDSFAFPKARQTVVLPTPGTGPQTWGDRCQEPEDDVVIVSCPCAGKH